MSKGPYDHRLLVEFDIIIGMSYADIKQVSVKTVRAAMRKKISAMTDDEIMESVEYQSTFDKLTGMEV